MIAYSGDTVSWYRLVAMSWRLTTHATAWQTASFCAVLAPGIVFRLKTMSRFSMPLPLTRMTPCAFSTTSNGSG